MNAHLLKKTTLFRMGVLNLQQPQGCYESLKCMQNFVCVNIFLKRRIIAFVILSKGFLIHKKVKNYRYWREIPSRPWLSQ